MKLGSKAAAISADNRVRALFAIAAITVAVLAVSVASPRAAGPFNPTIAMTLSTTRATAHPDARITITNPSASTNIKSLTMKLPNGFWGSLAAATKCSYANAQIGNCSSANQIGTVDTEATIDQSDSRLRGKVYLTEPAPAHVSTDPAGIAVVVPAVVGGVNLGNVVVDARVQVRNADLGATAPTGAVGQIQGVNAIVDSIPESITDSHGRTVAFHLNTMNIDLISDLDGPNPPLLTNPSVCSAIAISASFTSYEDTTASATDQTPDTITGCSGLRFNPTFSSSLTSPSAGGTTGLNATIGFPADSPSTKSINVVMPAFVGPNFPSFGTAADQCPASAAPTGNSPFVPTNCPAQAKVGTVTLTTPLLDGPVQGNVYLINKSPIPWLGIDINPNTSASNPKGVTIRLVGVTNTPQEDPTCSPATGNWGECPPAVSAFFNNLPDAPATTMQLNLGGPDRTGVSATLSGDILTTATPSDPACVPADENAVTLVSNAGSAVSKSIVSTQTTTGCDDRDVLIPSGGSSPVGGTTTDTTPSVDFVGQNGNEAGPFSCFFDSEANLEPCDSPYSPSSPLSIGIHRVFVSYTDYPQSRAFVVASPSSAPDTTAPVASITSPPTSVSTSDPTFNFTADGTADFQCALNPGNSITTAFLPCSTTSGTSGSASGSALNDGPLIAGYTYTFAVRAQDAAGNVGAADTATFTVDIPFDPTFNVALTSNVARSHPDMDVTLTNPSHEDLKDLKFSLPDGFFGGLTGVGELCSLSDADAGTCPADSQVGTVDTEAAIDESTIRISGNVYLTQPRDPATEPASLSIKIHPAIQDVVFHDIIVTAHLNIRGVAQGIDTLSFDLPHSADSQYGELTEFDLRKLVLHLRTGTGATYPLLTLPSYCTPTSFSASYTGWNATHDAAADTVSYSQPFQATGCGSLPFAPQLGINLTDANTGGIPAESTIAARVPVNLDAHVTSDPSGAGIANTTLTMPKPLTIDVQHLPVPCQPEQQAANACPATTVIGSAVATSPLLPDALTGTVYSLKADPSTGSNLPRVLVALRGAINVDIVATNSFVNQTQIQTKFALLPDVPLSTFSIHIGNGFLTTRTDGCDNAPDTWNVVGTLGGYNGASEAVNVPEKFDCPNAYSPTYVASFKFRKRNKSTATIALRPQLTKTLKSGTLTLPKGVTFNTKTLKNKKKLAKLIVVKGGNKKLTVKCFKVNSKTKFTVNLCKKSATSITLSFKAGSLVAKKKPKSPKFKLSAKQSDGKTAPAVLVAD